MFDRISVLKDKGYVPDLILDIGAYKGTWTDEMMNIYSNAQYMLFEAIDYDELKTFNSYSNVKTFNVLLNEKICEVDWFEKQNTGDSMFKELTYHFADIVPLRKNSIDLDSFMKSNSLSLDDFKNILIKIDCQGAEIPILKGSLSILGKTDFIILELPLFGKYNEFVPTFSEHIQFMDSIGFIPYDIVDNHYINKFNMQIDMLFINKNHEFNTVVKNMLL